MRDTSLGDDRTQPTADFGRDGVVLSSEASAQGGPGTTHERPAAIRVLLQWFVPLGIGSVVFLGSLILAPISAAVHSAAREMGPLSGSLAKVASIAWVQTGSPEKVCRFGGCAKLRAHKHSHAFPRMTPDNDPNDDETNDDPNDDVLWDDPNDGDDLGLPLVAWFEYAVFSHSRPDVGSFANSTEHASSPLLTTRRLRC